MRLFPIFIALAFIPASADVKARYTGQSGAALIEVDANGDARMGGEDEQSYSLFTASGDYVVFKRDGALVAARYADFHAVLNAITSTFAGPASSEAERPDAAPAVPPLVKVGTEKIAGYDGTRFELPVQSGPRAYAVISDAPELRPLGRAMARLLDQMPTFEQAMTGSRPPALSALVHALDSAALLRMDGAFTLAEVSFAELPDERFAVPTTLLSRDQVEKMLMPDPAAGGE